MKINLLLIATSTFLIFSSCKSYPIEGETQETVQFSSLPFENNDIQIKLVEGYVPYEAKNLQFIDEQNGAVLTTNNILYTTKNKGTQWVKAYSSNTEYTSINDMKLMDNQTILACGYIKTDLGLSNGFIIKTMDWGNTWQTVLKTPNADIRSLTISEDQTLYALASYKDSVQATDVLKSNDLGQSWEKISSVNFQDGYSITSISKTRLTMRVYEVYGGKTRFVSTNSGLTWSSDVPASSFPMNTIGFRPNINIGFGIQNEETTSSIYKTTNEGDNWTKQHKSIRGKFNKISVISTKSGMAFGQGQAYSFENLPNTFGVISYTVNGGQTWSDLILHTAALSVNSFYDNAHGYFVDKNQLYQITVK